jgi:hypothetical protein
MGMLNDSFDRSVSQKYTVHNWFSILSHQFLTIKPFIDAPYQYPKKAENIPLEF